MSGNEWTACQEAASWGAEAATPPACWYALYTRSHFEKSVAAELARKGVEAYLPLVREIHRWKDRMKAVETPVFPGYVFTRLADTPLERLRVLRTAGVVRILGQAGRIEPIPDIEIESIRKLILSRASFAAHPFLREGAWVRVKRGPLAGVEGYLVRRKNQDRLVISVEMLSQAVATEIDICDVERAAPPQRRAAAA